VPAAVFNEVILLVSGRVVGKYRLDVKLTAFEEIVFWIISTEGNLRDVRVELENAMTRNSFSSHQTARIP
jgi:hypothetical protein